MSLKAGDQISKVGPQHEVQGLIPAKSRETTIPADSVNLETPSDMADNAISAMLPSAMFAAINAAQLSFSTKHAAR